MSEAGYSMMSDGDLLELSHQLDDVSSQFKRMVMEAVKVEKAKQAAQHAKEMKALIDKHEEEKRELSRQREECRGYWYQNKAVNEVQHRSLVHRAEGFAACVASRGMHSVWMMASELQKKASETETHKFMLKRTFLKAWKAWHAKEKRCKSVTTHVNRSHNLRTKRSAFAAWRATTLKQTRTAREATAKTTAATEMNMVLNNHGVEVAQMNETINELKRQLEIESQHRGALEERLKIAFMRGVCALNLEAMQVMKTTESDSQISEDTPGSISATPIEAPSEDTTCQYVDPMNTAPLQRSQLHSVSHVTQSQPVVQAMPRGTNAAVTSANIMRSPHTSPPTPKPRKAPTRPPLHGHTAKPSLQSALTIREMQPMRRF
eukprot:TRINITY_DN30677_c0_g1_i1.p1 TRINITY_DN30677_c0_g1~~TRINITY_DN30677_c0_g1_i1.p1  ORF type:complete len:376 (+),score=84.11 TRINITY_DN30677_c0_g1_i1:65-1192(+)